MDLDALREASRLSPDNAPLLKLMAQAELAAFNLENAKRALDALERLAPSDPWLSQGRSELDSIRLRLTGNAPPPMQPPRPMPATGNPDLVSPSAAPVDHAGSSLDDIDAMLADVERKTGSRPQVTFSDVGGLDEVKEDIQRRILHPLKHPELYKQYGRQAGGGILLYGPPGCGKSLLAKAIAGEMSARWMEVGIHEILDMWMGNSEKNLHALFEKAREQSPTVLYFDEIDALAADRHDMRRSAGRTTINQFLSELDGSTASNEGILVFGATNSPWHLDPAFRRPGRFDRILFAPPPDEKGREAVLRIQLRDRPQGDIDFRKLAKKSDGLSGADLKSVVERACDVVLSESIKTGKAPSQLSTSHLMDALAKTTPSTKGWFETARNYALHGNHDGQYDDILKFMGLKK
jgi:transitional endoplasmic reticulum ATPase